MKTKTVRLPALGLVLMSCMLSPGIPVEAAVVLDQESNPGTTTLGVFLEDVSSAAGDNAFQAQTFTVGIGGTLDHVDVLLGAAGASTGTFTFELRTTKVDGSPDFVSAPLASVSTPYSLAAGTTAFSTVDLRAATIPVAPGDVLAVVGLSGSGIATVGDPAANWVGSDANPYAEGAYYAAFFGTPDTLAVDASAGIDLSFRSFVDTGSVPVPAAGGLLLAPLIMLGARVRKRPVRPGA